jgi:hypothetical protein
VISENTFKVLQYCTLTGSTPKVISDTLGIKYNTVRRILAKCHERDMMEVDAGAYITTGEGRIEARIYKEAMSRCASSPKVNKLEGVYVPTTGYQRNNGLVHIPSRGFSC